jgi:hypothetical protein
VGLIGVVRVVSGGGWGGEGGYYVVEYVDGVGDVELRRVKRTPREGLGAFG